MVSKSVAGNGDAREGRGAGWNPIFEHWWFAFSSLLPLKSLNLSLKLFLCVLILLD